MLPLSLSPSPLLTLPSPPGCMLGFKRFIDLFPIRLPTNIEFDTPLIDEVPPPRPHTVHAHTVCTLSILSPPVHC